MSPEIESAIQRAKTCAPICCELENACFVLAQEVERLNRQLTFIPETLVEPEVNIFTQIEPSYDAPIPLWEAYFGYDIGD